MYNKCIYGFIFFFSFFSFFDLIHISQMDIIMTAKHVMHSIFFFFVVFNKHNRGDIQLRFKQNKHHPFKPIFFNDFFFFRQMHHCHSLKYYTVKKKQYVYFLLSSVTVGGKQQPCSVTLKHISATICQNTFWNWQNGILQCLQFICFTQRVLITVVHDMNYYI